MSRPIFAGMASAAPANLVLLGKAPVKYATTAALPANTYSSSAQTLTANANGALTVDGQAAAVGDRCLVKNEATASNNGWYSVTNGGGASAKYVLTRSSDANASALISGGDLAWVQLGTTNGGTQWAMSNETFATLDTDNITFSNVAAGVTLGGDVTGPANNNTVVSLTGSAGTVTIIANTSLSGAAGTGALSFGSMTGNTALPTGNLSWAGAATKTGSLVSAAAFTITAGAASTWSTTAGGLTITSAAAATWGSSVDNAVTIGTATNRLAAINSIAYNVYAASADVYASAQLGSSSLRLGAGGATTALDVKLTRSAAATLQIDNNAGGAVAILPAADSIGNIGSNTTRWNLVRATTVTSGDLNLWDEARGARWTLREHRHFVELINRETGHRLAVATRDLSEHERLISRDAGE